MAREMVSDGSQWMAMARKKVSDGSESAFWAPIRFQFTSKWMLRAYETTSDDGLLEAEAQFVIYFSSN